MGIFSSQAFRDYGKSENTAAKNMRNAFRIDTIRFMDKAGWPSKDEKEILNDIQPDISNVVNAIPEYVSGFMSDEDRAFNIPAPNDKTSPASVKIVSRPKKVKKGTIMLGDKKGQEYTSTTLAHDEFVVKSNNSAFKK